MKSAIVSGLFLLTSSVPAIAQTSAQNGSSHLVGTWTGKWQSNGRSRANNAMEMEIAAVTPERVTGRVKFTTATTPPCSHDWQHFTTMKDGDKHYAQVNLGGRCGRVKVVFGVDPVEHNVMIGTYDGEYPDNGSIRLTRQ